MRSKSQLSQFSEQLEKSKSQVYNSDMKSRDMEDIKYKYQHLSSFSLPAICMFGFLQTQEYKTKT